MSKHCKGCQGFFKGEWNGSGWPLVDCPGCQECEQLRARLAKAERLCRAVSRCEESQGRFCCAHLHDCRCAKDRKISDVCTCGGDEYQKALAAWEEQDG